MYRLQAVLARQPIACEYAAHEGQKQMQVK